MSIIEKLKAEVLSLRRAKNFELAASISFAISEIEKVGKNNGNRLTTEDEAIKTVQNLVNKINEVMTYDVANFGKVSQEKSILESILPQMTSEEDVRVEIAMCIALGQNKGQIMKQLRSKFGALVDMKRVGQILFETYGV